MARRGSDAYRRRGAQVDALIALIDSHWTGRRARRQPGVGATGVYDTGAGVSLHGDVRGQK